MNKQFLFLQVSSLKGNNMNKQEDISGNINVIKIAFFMFCLTLLPFEQLNFINGFVKAQSDNLVEYNIDEVTQEVSVTPVISNDSLRKSLWQSNISPAKQQEEKVQKNELQSLIDQINSMEFVLEPQVFEDVQNEEPSESNISKEDVSPENDSEQINQNKTIQSIVNSRISEQTLIKLRKIAQEPETVNNPYQIGETLYSSSCIGDAALYYKEALNREKPDDINASNDRAWLLFQTGNCLREVDMLEASDYYRQLITEYPDYPWADIARIQSSIISWYENEKPNELITQYKK